MTSPAGLRDERLRPLRFRIAAQQRSPGVENWFMEYEKGRLVAKLRSVRERRRNETGKKVGGRKSHAELWPEVVAEARRLRRAKGKAGHLSYREISARLKDAGYRNERGEPFNPHSVRAMIEGPQPRPPRRP